MQFKTSVSIIIFLIFLSCKSQEKIEIKLKNCINEQINRKIEERAGKQPFDFYDFILSIENGFIDKKILKNTTSHDYFSLILKIIDTQSKELNEAYIFQQNLIDRYGFFAFSTESIFNQCPYQSSVIHKNGSGKLIYNQASILYKMMGEGFDNKDLLAELFQVVDEENFEKIIYRAPIIVLVMINLDKKYNLDLKKYEASKKNVSNNGS